MHSKKKLPLPPPFFNFTICMVANEDLVWISKNRWLYIPFKGSSEYSLPNLTPWIMAQYREYPLQDSSHLTILLYSILPHLTCTVEKLIVDEPVLEFHKFNSIISFIYFNTLECIS